MNTVVTGHRGLAEAEMFTNLDKIGKGDYFTFNTFGRVVTYRVIETKIVDPDQTETLDPVASKGPRDPGHLHPAGHQHPAHPRHRRTRHPHSARRPQGRDRTAGHPRIPLVDRHHGRRCRGRCRLRVVRRPSRQAQAPPRPQARALTGWASASARTASANR